MFFAVNISSDIGTLQNVHAGWYCDCLRNVSPTRSYDSSFTHDF